ASRGEGLPAPDNAPQVPDVVQHFPVKSTALPDLLGVHRLVVHAVDGISFSLRRCEIFGLVGESGCGKTTAGRTVLRLLEPTAGTIRFDGMDITHMTEAKLRPLRKGLQIIFQDPHPALTAAMTIGQLVAAASPLHQV